MRSTLPCSTSTSPGEETYVEDRGQHLKGSRVRIWAESADGSQWVDYKEADLWLVPEIDSDKQHRYNASEIETYDFSFSS
jgi:hypothetical protein